MCLLNETFEGIFNMKCDDLNRIKYSYSVDL